MKIYLFISLYFCFSNLVFAVANFPLLSDWKKLEEKKDIVIYKSLQEPEKMITVAWLEVGEIDIHKGNFKAEVEKMQSSRQRINGFMGLDQWKIDKSDFIEDRNGKTLSLEGSYKKDGQEFLFWERQIFVGPKYRQIKIESPRAKAPSTEEISKIFAAIGNVE